MGVLFVPFRSSRIAKDSLPLILSSLTLVRRYEKNPVEWDPQDDFAYGLFDLDWDIFAPHIEAHVNRVPKIGEVGIQSTVCGPESFTPDHKPLLGETSTHGFWLNCGYNSAGIMMGPGCGLELANWIVKGKTDLDMFGYNIMRYDRRCNPDEQWVRERSHETYAQQSVIPWRHDPPLGGRTAKCMKHSPLQADLEKAGAVFTEVLGWERPMLFTYEANKFKIPGYDYQGAENVPEGVPCAEKLGEDNAYLQKLGGYYTWGKWDCWEEIRAENDRCRNGML